jgi:S-adenosylmethionine/arginine decarboxylase-like enzyme
MVVRQRRIVAAAALALSVVAMPVSAQQADGVAQLLRRLEGVVKAGDVDAFTAAALDSERTRVREFAANEIASPVTRAVIQERDREQLRGTLPGDGYRLMVDLFAESADRARVATWRLDLRRVGDSGTDRDWAIVEGERISSVESLYRLALNTAKQFTARDLKISAEDLDLTLSEGSVFVSEVDQGVTAVVLLGRGTMSFHPDPQTEKGQVKIFTGGETLESAFESAFVRLNPSEFEQLLTTPQLQARAAGTVDSRELKRALDVFREESVKSFVIDLGDLSRDPWSLLPGPTDFLAEIKTRRYDTITYARSAQEAEDITVFDRKRHRNIALYASKQKLESRGRFYNEDELVDYDVIDYDIDVASIPERQWIEGRTRIYLKTRAYVLNTITLKLADSLVVQSIVSNEFGRLFGIRVKNQNTLVVNLPSTVLKDTTLTLNLTYAGRLESQVPEREAVGTVADPQQRQPEGELPVMSAEPSYLYSSRSFWYPQAVVSDYATARIRLSVPANYEAVASGQLEPGFPTMIAGKDSTQNRKLYAYVASQPLRYLAFVVSRFVRAETVTIGFPEVPKSRMEGVAMAGLSYRSLNLAVEANPRQVSRGRDLVDRAADIATFYQSIIGDSPYSSFTIALVESDLPGGHSPAYFASLNQPLPTTQLVWRNDPAAFNNFPEFFIAHEIAHQWWGQAIGWRNYHEQWISEGFAQYFAALYAQHHRGDDAFNGVIRQMRRWAIEQSEQGPVSLGYRLGHIRGESRVFRALVYNKSGVVLHMLRRLVGDEAFFSGVRRFYRTMRFKKAGTEDFRAAMEAASGRSLERFFERWIYNASLPRLTFNHRVEGSDVVLHFEQTGEIFDLPVTVVLNYGDRKSTIVVPVTERVVDKRVPLEGTLRGIDINKDDGTLAEIIKAS